MEGWSLESVLAWDVRDRLAGLRPLELQRFVFSNRADVLAEHPLVAKSSAILRNPHSGEEKLVHVGFYAEGMRRRA